jgi:hypothetical protein
VPVVLDAPIPVVDVVLAGTPVVDVVLAGVPLGVVVLVVPVVVCGLAVPTEVGVPTVVGVPIVVEVPVLPVVDAPTLPAGVPTEPVAVPVVPGVAVVPVAVPAAPAGVPMEPPVVPVVCAKIQHDINKTVPNKRNLDVLDVRMQTPVAMCLGRKAATRNSAWLPRMWE